MKRELPKVLSSRQQRLLAWVLLSVYVPMVLLSSLHVHSLREVSQMVECNLCETSVHHQGHITANQQHHGECLSCRFLSTMLVVFDDYDRDCDIQCVNKLEFTHSTSPIARLVACPTLRGPPVIL